jgi:hypothetical protein
MKCPNLNDYKKNASSVDPDDTKMYGVYRGGAEAKQIATYYPRAAEKDWEKRKLLQNVKNAGKK